MPQLNRLLKKLNNISIDFYSCARCTVIHKDLVIILTVKTKFTKISLKFNVDTDSGHQWPLSNITKILLVTFNLLL